ncbi:unnamed protein product [Ectocarpus fasciculatus]
MGNTERNENLPLCPRILTTKCRVGRRRPAAVAQNRGDDTPYFRHSPRLTPPPSMPHAMANSSQQITPLLSATITAAAATNVVRDGRHLFSGFASFRNVEKTPLIYFTRLWSSSVEWFVRVCETLNQRRSRSGPVWYRFLRRGMGGVAIVGDRAREATGIPVPCRVLVTARCVWLYSRKRASPVVHKSFHAML